jgi:isoquinoline 1-oxidoreductase beta subunit
MDRNDLSISRRQFFKGAGGLVVALSVPVANGRMAAAAQASSQLQPNAFVRIDGDSAVTVVVKHSEMGQGPLTGLTTLIAEELDADWAQMKAVQAPANAEVFNNLSFGPLQGTGASSSMANAYDQTRQAGALARRALVEAAAVVWNVPAAEIAIERGIISHSPSSRSGRFGDFVEFAASRPFPTTATPKDPSQFRLIGREKTVRKIDVPEKVNGSAIYTMDIHEPGMLTVVIARSPRIGGVVASYDDAAARQIPGVKEIKQIAAGVAVYATGTWAALKARETLDIVWDNSHAVSGSTAEYFEHLSSIAKTPGAVAASKGDAIDALSKADEVLEVEYRFPHLSHSPMEPINCYLMWDGTRVRARYGSQIQTLDQLQFAKLFNIDPKMVEIETLFSGGSFGRRIDVGNDFIAEIVDCAKAIGPNRPLKLVWSREDDIHGGFYRPIMVHRMRGALENGKIVAWNDVLAGQSFSIGTPMEAGYVHNGIDQLTVEGSSEIPYQADHFRCDQHIVKLPITTTSLRGVAFNHTIYAVECFVDELLERGGLDPVEGRLALIENSPRLVNVLRAVASMADWNGAQIPAGRARGVAISQAFGTYIAEIAEVSCNDGGEPRVHKVWCAVDCGVPVNPDVIRAQVEGAIAFGLGLVLYGQITIDEGAVVQSNFNDYRPLRIHEMPAVDVQVIRSAEKPSGIGEPGLPPIGPAVANALARLGKVRPRSLPMVA